MSYLLCEQYALFLFITFNPLFASFKKVRCFITKRKTPNTTLFLFNHHIYFSFLWVLIAFFIIMYENMIAITTLKGGLY